MELLGHESFLALVNHLNREGRLGYNTETPLTPDKNLRPSERLYHLFIKVIFGHLSYVYHLGHVKHLGFMDHGNHTYHLSLVKHESHSAIWDI